MPNEDKGPKEAFNNVAQIYPELTMNAAPAGMGCFGLVIGHDDNTITKITFRPEDENQRRFAEQNFANEITAMQLFSDFPLQGIKTPVLVEPPEKLDHEDYIGCYRMTRIPGKPLRWWPVGDEILEVSWLKKQHAVAGEALAKFHKAVTEIPFEFLRNGECYDDGNIQKVDGLPDGADKAFEDANNYLQAHKVGGVVHGDFHNGNILADEGGSLTGIVDFSFTGRSRNIYTDFRCIPDRFKPEFLHAYETTSGKKLDPYVLAATELGIMAGYLNYLRNLKEEDNPERNIPAEETQTVEQINKCLNELIPVTGFKP